MLRNSCEQLYHFSERREAKKYLYSPYQVLCSRGVTWVINGGANLVDLKKGLRSHSVCVSQGARSPQLETAAAWQSPPEVASS